ncbi:Gti1/Pac2 family-domain-containing protein [Diplogelasinospora grovesii]|uniref:Gti1/Pac2 family-domain-containing protein n=1 Tax=Diplogelasinospora grovesii TaxID=303347 RepID=A0AAN6S2C4_9PEZI|nr:Gti1/Pac2 family-domain-containing protein [Diplogelasinospora grovesii]
MSKSRLSLAGPQSSFQPTYQGFIDSTSDVCLLLEMCLNGQLCHVPRLPHDRERRHVIQSGNVFIYEEGISGIQRWTDGINWSPSCTLGNFLIYREIGPATGSKPDGSLQTRGSAALLVRREDRGYVSRKSLCSEDQELYGAPIHSYKPNAFTKKTITVTVDGVPRHIVSYYTAEDVRSGRLKTPTQDPLFCGIIPRDSLTRSPSFQVTSEHE